MAVTIQSVLDLARLDLNDADKIRHTDVQLLKFCNDGIAHVRVMRPDLNWGNFGTEPSDLTVNDNFPFNIEYRDAVGNYIVAMAEKSDDAYSNEQKAAQAMKLFTAQIGVG